jgi:hypothetical protein
MNIKTRSCGRTNLVLSGALFASMFAFGACTTQSAARKPSVGVVPSNHALVLPSVQMRTAQLYAGLPEPGSDFGPFTGRRDRSLGALSGGPERVDYGYERRIYDRQYSTSGRPYTTYIDTTRAITRVGQ